MTNAVSRRNAPLLTGHGGAPTGLLTAALRLPVVVLDEIAAWQQRSEERAAMTDLSSQQRRDIGLTAAQLEAMAGKVRWSR